MKSRTASAWSTPSITAPRDCYRAKRRSRSKRRLPRARWNSERRVALSLRCGVLPEERLAETMLEMGTVPRRKREGQAVALDLYLKEKRASAPVDARAHGRNFGVPADHAGIGKPARAGDRR